LQGFATWPMSPLEKAESLEQLRFMHHGIRIYMTPGAGTELAVDTPEQALDCFMRTRMDAIVLHNTIVRRQPAERDLPVATAR